MSEQPDLERRYRQRLAWYPKDYRRQHEEDMLTVLLSGARPGQRRPQLAETVDLFFGAVRMRLRLVQPYPGEAGRDALAMFTVLAPLLLVGPAVVMLLLVKVPHLPGPPSAQVLKFESRSLYESFELRRYALERGYASAVHLVSAGQLAVALAVLLRIWRLALALIVIILAWWIALGRYGFEPTYPLEELFLISYLLEGAALVGSLGPSRGLQLLNWKSVALLVAPAVSLTYIVAVLTTGSFQSGAGPRELVEAVLVLAIAGLVVTLVSRPGRYLASLYLTMLYPLALYLGRLGQVVGSPQQKSPVALLFVPPLVAAGAIILAALRRSAGYAPPERGSGTSAHA